MLRLVINVLQYIDTYISSFLITEFYRLIIVLYFKFIIQLRRNTAIEYAKMHTKAIVFIYDCFCD